MAWAAAFSISAIAFASILKVNQNIGGTIYGRVLVLTTIIVTAVLLLAMVSEARKEIAASIVTLLGTLAGYMLKGKDVTDTQSA